MDSSYFVFLAILFCCVYLCRWFEERKYTEHETWEPCARCLKIDYFCFAFEQSWTALSILSIMVVLWTTCFSTGQRIALTGRECHQHASSKLWLKVCGPNIDDGILFLARTKRYKERNSFLEELAAMLVRDKRYRKPSFSSPIFQQRLLASQIATAKSKRFGLRIICFHITT